MIINEVLLDTECRGVIQVSKANLVDYPITRLHTVSRSNSTQAITSSIRSFENDSPYILTLYSCGLSERILIPIRIVFLFVMLGLETFRVMFYGRNL